MQTGQAQKNCARADVMSGKLIKPMLCGAVNKAGAGLLQLQDTCGHCL